VGRELAVGDTVGGAEGTVDLLVGGTGGSEPARDDSSPVQEVTRRAPAVIAAATPGRNMCRL
jgi:hypothetical protein